MRIRTWMMVAVGVVLGLPSAWAEDDWRGVRKDAAKVEEAARKAKKRHRLETDPEKVVRSIPGRRNPKNIFEWIRDNIDYEPYIGSLRGAEGTLAAGSGNSADQAALLVALFEAAGHEARFVRGRLYDKDIERILDAFVGEATLLAPGEISSGKDYEGARASQDPRYTQLVREHVWAEVKYRGKDVPADPVASDSFGIAKAKVLERTDDLPSAVKSSLEIAIGAVLVDGQQRTPATIRAPLSSIANRNVSLTFERDLRIKDGHRPILRIGNKKKKGDALPAGKVERLQLNFKLRRGRVVRKWTQTLFRRGVGLDLFAYDQQYYSIAVLPGWVGPDVAAHEGASVVENTAEAIRDLAKKAREEGDELSDRAVAAALNDIHAPLGFAVAVSFAAHLDRLSRGLARTLGVVPIILEPRIVTVGIHRKGDHYAFEIDDQGTSFEAMPRRGIPAAAAAGFLTLQGRLENQLEGAVLEEMSGDAIFTVDRFFDAAEEKRIPVTTLDSSSSKKLKEMKLDAALRESLEKLVRGSGAIILITKRPVKRNDHEYVGWWTLHPSTGMIQGSVGDVIMGTTTEKEPTDEASLEKILDAANDLAARMLELSTDADETETAYSKLVCEARDDVKKLAGAFCARRKAVKLPKLRACVEGIEEGAEGDVLSVARACKDRTAPMRCGAVIADAFLNGKLTALYTAETQDFEPSKGKKSVERKAGKATGITCR